ncbi:MAG: hypothetical protein OXE92_05675 [Bacteroidetes bacterium]|nr:hypothetical protein [Bacteroidota bacterium]MCY4205198.1 hypothetical protein [Bacteroidota bacterium]
MPYDAGESPVKFAEIPLTDGISEPLFNKALIFLQTRGAWSLSRSVLWVYPLNMNDPVIWTANISALILTSTVTFRTEASRQDFWKN